MFQGPSFIIGIVGIMVALCLGVCCFFVALFCLLSTSCIAWGADSFDMFPNQFLTYILVKKKMMFYYKRTSNHSAGITDLIMYSWSYLTWLYGVFDILLGIGQETELFFDHLFILTEEVSGVQESL